MDNTVKASTIKTFTDVHTWTGLGAGLALFIAFYAGAITVFTHELDAWDNYGIAKSEAGDIRQANELLSEVIATQPVAGETIRLNISSPEHPGNHVMWFERLEDGDFKRHDFHLNEDGTLDTSGNTSELAGFIYALHYNLGIPTDWGLWLLGVICFIYGIALVSGVVIFIPNFVKDIFVVRPGKNKKRFWLDTHNIVGVLSLPWHIMFAWSSALLAIAIFLLAPFQLTVFKDDITSRLGSELGVVQAPEPSGIPGAMLTAGALLDIARLEVPGLEPTQLRVSNVGDSNATVRVIGKTHSEHMEPYANIVMMATDGRILSVSQPETASAGATFYRGLIALHFASFGGYLTKWLYFILGLAGAYLFYSGNLLWVESRRKRRSQQQTPASLFLARLNSGVCIGCMAGISAAFLASRGLADLADRAYFMKGAYYGVFFAAILWSFVRPVATGTRELLQACALLTAAIPILDIALLDTTPWSAAAQGHYELLTVDLMAIVAAACFWFMAAKLNKRAISGDPNSVWAAHPTSPHGTEATVASEGTQ